MAKAFNSEHSAAVERFDIALLKRFDTLKIPYAESVVHGMKYANFPGGKRLRAVLLMKTYEVFKDSKSAFYDDVVLPFAMAIELIHAYSLVHDDLPCMDDDDMRRGKESVHIKFGESMGVLVGDALLNYAYEIIADTISVAHRKYPEAIGAVCDAFKIMSNLSGVNGMIGGQVIDISNSIESYDANNGEEKLLKMVAMKTGALIGASIAVGARLGSASDDDFKNLMHFADSFGFAFQISDDCLDFEEDCEISKPTFATLYGLEAAGDFVKKQTAIAIDSLSKIDNTDFLRNLTETVVNRVE